jgi:DNA-binding transcriptional LysR family regulator
MAPSQWAGLELRHLLAFHAIVEFGSFHKAAAHLDCTQSGISQQIAALERIIGERLFERPGGSRPVRLTGAGAVVLRHSLAVLGQISGALAEVAALRDGKGGALRVGAFQSVGGTVLPPLLRRLRRDLPDLGIELTQTTTDAELLVQLGDDRLDITFAILPIPAGPFVAIELFADSHVLMASPHTTWARRGGRVSARELANAPLISATHACPHNGRFEAQLREHGFEPTVVYRSDDNGTVRGLVAAGVGVAVVPRLMAQSTSDDVAIIELDEWLPPRRVALSWRNDRPCSPSRQAFVGAVEMTCTEIGLSVSGEILGFPRSVETSPLRR